MRLIAISSLLTGLLVGLYLQGHERPAAMQGKDVPNGQDCASIFRRMEATKAQTSHDRAFIEMYRAWAPAEAAWALRLLDDVDARIALAEEQAVHGRPVDLNELQRLIGRYHDAAENFRAAGKRGSKSPY